MASKARSGTRTVTSEEVDSAPRAAVSTQRKIRQNAVQIPDRRYFRIGDVAELLGVKAHVLRYWETEFRQIKPQKSRRNQRLYRRRDVEVVLAVRKLLYEEKYTIAGARDRLKELIKDGQVELFAAPKVPLQALHTGRLEQLRDGLASLLALIDRRESDLRSSD